MGVIGLGECIGADGVEAHEYFLEDLKGKVV